MDTKGATKVDTNTVMRCEDCPDREFDNPGSARGHANRLGHHLVATSLSLIVRPGGGAPTLTGEMRERLEALAEEIRQYAKIGQDSTNTIWEARFQIGRRMAEAREMMKTDLEFGRWLRDQNFGFGKQVAWQHLLLGRHEDEARALVSAYTETGGGTQPEGVGWKPVLKAITPPKVVDPDKGFMDHGLEYRRIHRLLDSSLLYDVIAISPDAEDLSRSVILRYREELSDRQRFLESTGKTRDLEYRMIKKELKTLPTEQKIDWIRAEFKRVAEHLALLYQQIGE